MLSTIQGFHANVNGDKMITYLTCIPEDYFRLLHVFPVYGREILREKKNIYIYIYAVKLLSGPSLGFLEVIIWSK